MSTVPSFNALSTMFMLNTVGAALYIAPEVSLHRGGGYRTEHPPVFIQSFKVANLQTHSCRSNIASAPPLTRSGT